jgi:acyl-CoA reductase-like NAD-dependent aldehyde dehydrogenase
MNETKKTEEFKITGDQVLTKIKELLHEGNIRRITLKNEEGRTLIEIPLTLGVVGAILLPVWAAIGAVAALATRCSILVERSEQQPPSDEGRE